MSNETDPNFWKWAWTALTLPIAWLIARQERIKEKAHEQAIAIATMGNDLKHVNEKMDAIHVDVKKLLRKKR